MTQPVHRLKTWPEPFAALRRGDKTFEIRWNDRDYQPGDLLDLAEFDPIKGAFTGEVEERLATYVLAGEAATQFGIMPGYVGIGLAAVRKTVEIVDPADLTRDQLRSWHEAQAHNAHLRAENWRKYAADFARSGAAVAVGRFQACADSGELEAGFHARAAILLREITNGEV